MKKNYKLMKNIAIGSRRNEFIHYKLKNWSCQTNHLSTWLMLSW